MSIIIITIPTWWYNVICIPSLTPTYHKALNYHSKNDNRRRIFLMNNENIDKLYGRDLEKTIQVRRYRLDTTLCRDMYNDLKRSAEKHYMYQNNHQYTTTKVYFIN